jgi:hypothetical protein
MIKALKKILSVDVSMYMVKKTMLLWPIETSSYDSYDLLFTIMSQVDLKEKFESKIDYDRWTGYKVNSSEEIADTTVLSGGEASLGRHERRRNSFSARV